MLIKGTLFDALCYRMRRRKRGKLMKLPPGPCSSQHPVCHHHPREINYTRVFKVPQESETKMSAKQEKQIQVREKFQLKVYRYEEDSYFTRRTNIEMEIAYQWQDTGRLASYIFPLESYHLTIPNF